MSFDLVYGSTPDRSEFVLYQQFSTFLYFNNTYKLRQKNVIPCISGTKKKKKCLRTADIVGKTKIRTSSRRRVVANEAVGNRIF